MSIPTYALPPAGSEILAEGPPLHAKSTPDPLRLSRTPSPTPSEVKSLNDDGRIHFREMFKLENWRQLLIILILCILIILMIIFHDPLVEALEPAAEWMYHAPGGWLIPIAILILLSVPPLVGHEIIVVLIGLTWGLGAGFGIAAAGTLIGELGTFFLFKFWLRGRAEKYEEREISYALLARNIRDGGLKMAIVARYSVIPGHLLTALFTACGMTLRTFLISAVVSLPRQFVAVYLGYALGQTSEDGSSNERIVQYVVVGITVVVTILAARYMRNEQNKVRPTVIYERRKRRQAQLHQPMPLSAAYPPPAFMVGDAEQGMSDIPIPQPNYAPGSVRSAMPARTHMSTTSRDGLLSYQH